MQQSPSGLVPCPGLLADLWMNGGSGRVADQPFPGGLPVEGRAVRIVRRNPQSLHHSEEGDPVSEALAVLLAQHRHGLKFAHQAKQRI